MSYRGTFDAEDVPTFTRFSLSALAGFGYISLFCCKGSSRFHHALSLLLYASFGELIPGHLSVLWSDITTVIRCWSRD